MHINLCGMHAIHRNYFVLEKPKGSGDFLFLRIKAPTVFTIEGVEVTVGENTIMLYKKGHPQSFRGAEELHIDDFMHFDADGAEDEAFMERLGLVYNTPLSIPYIPLMSIHQNLCMEFVRNSELRSQSIDCLLRYFLIKLAECMNTSQRDISKDEIRTRLHELRIMFYGAPHQSWSVGDMSRFVNISPSYFQKLYKDEFGISCVSDIINIRIERACQLLETTYYPVNLIAAMLGYDSNVYFSRQFKSVKGMSALEYRRRARAPKPAVL